MWRDFSYILLYWETSQKKLSLMAPETKWCIFWKLEKLSNCRTMYFSFDWNSLSTYVQYDKCTFLGHLWKLYYSKCAKPTEQSSMPYVPNLKISISTHILLCPFSWSRLLLFLFMSDYIWIYSSLDFVVSNFFFVVQLCFIILWFLYHILECVYQIVLISIFSYFSKSVSSTCLNLSFFILLEIMNYLLGNETHWLLFSTISIS